MVLQALISPSTISRHTGEVDPAVAVRAQKQVEGRDDRRKIGRKKIKIGLMTFEFDFLHPY